MRFVLFVVLLSSLLSACAGKSHFFSQGDGAVTFYLRCPQASEVQLVSSRDRFQPHPATRNSDGTWQVEVRSSGQFRYFYLVDGVVVVPECEMSEMDDFGGKNCLYVE